MAAFYGRVDAVALLMQKGADPTLVCANSEVPLHIVSRKSNFKMADALLNPTEAVESARINGWAMKMAW